MLDRIRVRCRGRTRIFLWLWQRDDPQPGPKVIRFLTQVLLVIVSSCVPLLCDAGSVSNSLNDGDLEVKYGYAEIIA